MHSQEDVVQYYMYSAERGDVGAQLVAGQLHYQGGHGVRQNVAEAFRYFDQAAQMGDANAMAYLGEMYATGRGVPQNNNTARTYYERSAAKHNAHGLNGLGTLYLHGQGIAKDPKQAFAVSAPFESEEKKKKKKNEREREREEEEEEEVKTKANLSGKQMREHHGLIFNCSSFCLLYSSSSSCSRMRRRAGTRTRS